MTQGAQTFTDLSAAGRANCYIVAPKSASVFDAAYKGINSFLDEYLRQVPVNSNSALKAAGSAAGAR